MTAAEPSPPVGNAHPTGEKSQWPEVLGWMATPAVQTIAHERPDVAVEVLPQGTRIEPDGFNAARVRVHIDNNGHVSKVPEIG
jgi:hypothetical protein